MKNKVGYIKVSFRWLWAGGEVKVTLGGEGYRDDV